MTDNTYLTALEKLGDAVDTFVQATAEEGEEPPLVSGFVLCYQEQRFQTDPDFMPVTTATTYAMSAATTGETALGMLRLNQPRIERDILAAEDGDDDD